MQFCIYEKKIALKNSVFSGGPKILKPYMLHSTYPKHIYPHQPGDAPEPWQPRPPSDLGRSPLQAPGRGARGELRPPGDPLMIYLILMMSKTMMIPTSAWPKLAASIRTVHLSLRTQSVSLRMASIMSTISLQISLFDQHHISHH